MLGAQVDEETLENSPSNNDNLSTLNVSHEQFEYSTSPVTHEDANIESSKLAHGEKNEQSSIEIICHSNSDIESVDECQSNHSISSHGNELQMEFEVQDHVGDADINTKEDVKEVVIVENEQTSGTNLPANTKKLRNISKEMPLKVKNLPTIMERKATNMKSTIQKPPATKKNMSNTSRRTKSLSGTSIYEERYSKDQSSVDLGSYLLKKVKDIISSGNNTEKAFDLAMRAKQSFESSTLEKPNLDYVLCLHILASMHCSLGQHNEAIPLLERSIELPNTDLGQNHALAKFVGCMRLGDIYAMRGKIEKSLVLYNYGLEIQKKSLGDKDPRFGQTCRYVAEAHIQAFQFDEAENLCQMALNIQKVKNSPSSIEEAADRRLMGLICDSKGKYEVALKHYSSARTTMSDGGYELDAATIDCNIGDSYLALARYDDAILSYQKALNIFKSTKGENHPTIGFVYVRLAELYNKVGKFGDSKSYCEKALSIYNSAPPNTDMEDIANGMIDLAAIYESMTELDEALKVLHKAAELYGNNPTEQCTIAGIEVQIGVIYYMLVNHVESYKNLKNAISRFQASGEKKSSLYGITLNQLGLVCVRLHAISEAIDYFEEAKSILEKEYGAYHPDTLAIYSNLAGAYDALERSDDAINLLEFVVNMREEKLGTADHIADDEKKRLLELLKEAGKARRRKSRSLEALLDKDTPILTRSNSTI